MNTALGTSPNGWGLMLQQRVMPSMDQYGDDFVSKELPGILVLFQELFSEGGTELNE